VLKNRVFLCLNDCSIFLKKSKEMLEIFLVLIVIILVVGLCLHHHSMKKKLRKHSDQEVDLVRKAAEHSIMASNSVNPILSLISATKAVQILESLHERHGPELASDLTKVDTREMLAVVTNQKERITKDVMHQLPEMMPQHPLAAHAGFQNERITK
jgi:hypothetical protein